MSFLALQSLLASGGKLDNQSVPKLLPKAKLNRIGRFNIQALGNWRFLLAEYTGHTKQRKVALIKCSDTGTVPLNEAPSRILGIADVTSDGELIWTWLPSKQK